MPFKKVKEVKGWNFCLDSITKEKRKETALLKYNILASDLLYHLCLYETYIKPFILSFQCTQPHIHLIFYLTFYSKVVYNLLVSRRVLFIPVLAVKIHAQIDQFINFHFHFTRAFSLRFKNTFHRVTEIYFTRKVVHNLNSTSMHCCVQCIQKSKKKQHNHGCLWFCLWLANYSDPFYAKNVLMLESVNTTPIIIQNKKANKWKNC